MAIARNISINDETYELEPSKGQRVYVGICSTGAATNPKVCTVETFPVNGIGKPYKGTEIVVKFTATNSSTSTTPQLNVNGTGAIRIWYNNAVLASAKSAYAGYANRYLHYVYDGTYWVFMGHSVDNNSTYSNVALGQGYAVQNNSAASATITATLGSYALTANGIVSVKFLYDVPANATLNINGKGAKAIYNKDAAITSNVIKAGDTATFIYNTYYRLISVDRWQDKQDAISDLAAIRSGAAAGATALQSYTETDPTVPAWAKASTKPSYTASEVGAVPTTRTVNGKALSSDITLSASDIGAIPTAISTTYNDLVTVRTNSQLIEGAWYRITDYTCTTSQTDTQSAGHQFDILVQAISPNRLSEEARAIRHEGDTYFANSDLEAWKIWYCLDNDTTRFAWADATNGKGVIYRMVDEWGNDCPYDFKNIQFKRYQLKNRNYLYASKALWDNDGNTYDNGVIANFHNTFTILYNNLNTSINTTNIPFYYTSGVHDEYYIVDESEIYGYDEIYETYRDNSGNAIALSENGTRKFVALYNLLYDYYDIILEVNDTEGEWMYTFSRKNGINTPSVDNSLNGKIYNNKFTNSKRLFDNIFISYNIDLTIQGNVFGPSFQNNTFGNSCYSNIFGDGCYNNTFGDGCYNNTFGDGCYNNIFGNKFSYNTFGNSCYSNIFGNECNNNFFGNECYSNTFGDHCSSNTVGNAVNHVTFSKDYTYYVIVENGNQYITLTSTATTNYNNRLRNITIAQGVNNTSTTKTISHNTLNDTFRTTYTTDVNGNIYAIVPAKYNEWDNKQSALVSGTNIKTINNQSLVGSGNLTLSNIGADIFVVNIASNGNNGYTCDKTNAEIYAAWSNGRDVIADADGYIYHLCLTPTLSTALFSGLMEELGRERYDVETKSNVQTVTYYYDSIQRNLISGTNIKTINNQSLLGSGNIEIESGGTVTVENVTDTGDVVKSLEPNIFYKFGTVNSLTIPLISGTDLAVYSGKFTIDSLSTALSFFVVPATVITAYSCPTITAGNTYEFNILDNVLMMLEI